MNISELFIKRPIMTLLVMISILFFGIFAFKTLPVSDLPNVDYPTIQVSATYPGAKPETMANNVTAPLEKEFATIQGLLSIFSTSTTSSSTIVLQFALDKSMDAAAQDVQSAINQATPQLPQDLPYSPTYTKVNPTATPILYLALTSEMMTLGDLYDYANAAIGRRMNMIEGVAQVETYGSPFAVRIRIDPQKIAAKGIGIDEVAEAIKGHNVDLPTGLLYGPKSEFTINADGQLYRAEQYNNLIIKTKDKAVVRLKDIGYAIDSLSDDKYYLRYITQNTNQNSVILAVKTQPGANALTVMRHIDEILPKLKSDLPGSVEMHKIYDKSEYIKEAVHDVEFTLIIAFALVVAVIFIYLGRAMNTFIPSLALPLCIAGTFAMMSILGFTVDILSLLAITLSIGFLVDDAIVVLENIVRHVEEGTEPYQAALDGSKQISLTIVSMTLCLASVFIPMLFMGGVIGKIFNEFACVIFVAVLISGFISLSLTPMLCSRLVPPHHEERQKGRVEQFSDRLNARLIDTYKRSLEWVLSHRKTVLATAILSLFLTIFVIQTLPKDFLPPDDVGYIEAFTQTPDGTSPFRQMDYQDELSKIVQKNPYIDSIISLGAYPVDNQGVMFIRLNPISKRPPIQKVIHQLYTDMNQVIGVESFLKPMPLINLEIGTESSRGDYQFTLQSLHENLLYPAAINLTEKIKKLPGFTQVTSDLHMSQPQLKIEILRDRASMLNVDAFEIENSLGLAFANGNLSPIRFPDNQYYVIMEVEPKFYRDPSMLSQLYVRSRTGTLVPLDAVTKTSQVVGPLAVNHLNSLPSVTITFNLTNISLSTAIATLQKLAKQELPPTVSSSVQGTADVFKATFGNLTMLVIITIFIIYVVLGILYENFFHPITVMSTLPPAALGALLTLLIFGEPFSLYPFVGIIMLLGIVMKNGIIMVDFANEAVVKEGKSPHEAIMHACTTRFRPILMTTVAALMGAVPIALGLGGMTAQSRRPLGLVIVGGLIFSQILTLYFTPVTYLYIEALRERLTKDKGQPPPEPEEEPSQQ